MTFGVRIWVPSPNMWQEKWKSYDKNMETIWKLETTLFSYYFHIIFIFLYMPGLGPMPNPIPVPSPIRIPSPIHTPPQPCPRLPQNNSITPGPGPGPQNVKIIWKKYENNVIYQFHIIFICYSCYFHIFIIFLGSGPRSGPQKSYFCNIPGHILFIWFSYLCENLVFRPVHTDNLYKLWHRFLAPSAESRTNNAQITIKWQTHMPEMMK